MNKKFSTLVASLLLASGVGNGVYAQALSTAIEFTETATTVTTTNLPAYDDVKKEGGYEVGKSYFLNVGNYDFLVAEEIDGEVFLYAKTVASGEFTTVEEAEAALWVVSSINAPAGAVAPQYVFVNKATHAVLAMNPGNAVSIYKADGNPIGNLNNVVNSASNKLEGSQVEWLSAPSYKNPTSTQANVYASVSNDMSVALYKTTQSTAYGNKVVLVKLPTAKLSNTANLVKVTPKIANANSTFVLTPNQLNTMLGQAGEEATEDSYFQLSFDPAASVNGDKDFFAVDLQAMAVDQFELKYGEKDDSDQVIKPSNSNSIFASFYPKTSASGKYSDMKAAKNVVGFKADEDAITGEIYAWYTIKNRKNEYLVVDTAYIDGTDQSANKRITFKWDGLYNAKNDTRYRDPRSYLFQFVYNPQTGDVNIKSLAYVTKVASNSNATTDNATFYEGDYTDAVNFYGSEWYAKDANNVIEKAYVSRAALSTVSEVTLGNLDNPTAAPTGANAFKITLGNSAMYQPAYVASGAYLMKVTGSKDKARIGKYYVNNLGGDFEIMEQAIRQNFQHMPAAQWIVRSSGTTAGSPVLIKNREFENIPNDDQELKNVFVAGTVYGVAGAAGVQGFTMGSDTIEFIPVADVKDKFMGYKYVANDTISESLFTFNYLHDLGMDKPINTKNDKDSVVWVDKNGESMKFILEAVADDTYGTTNGVAGITGLTRRIYKIKVNDASKLQNDKRYLAYDEASKKYIVSEGNGDIFFIKENNEVENGSCYYALVKANAYPMVSKSRVSNADMAITSRQGWTVLDDAQGSNDVFLAEWGTYYDKIDGLSNHEGWAVKLFNSEEEAQAVVEKMGISGYGTVQKIVDSTPVDGSEVELKKLGANDAAFNGKYVINFNVAGDEEFASDNYADFKVSVDNNTLDLVNGVLSNEASLEVATSAFAVTRDADPLYRRFNTENEGVASDEPDVLKFFRVNAAAPEYLYEDATSSYSKDKGFNFLGVEGKGDSKNAAIYVDTAYVDRGTKMPQYMLALRPEFVKGDTTLCDAQNHAHKTEEEALACPHSSVTPTYTDAWYLINLQDSIDANTGNAQAKYQWNNRYTRLGFVKARHIGDTLVIDNSIYSDNKEQIKKGEAATWAGKDSIFLGDNKHKNVVFSFRLLKSGSNDFLIESETSKMENGKEVNVKNSQLEAARIAPMQGGWIKIQNGVPVIANCSYEEAGREAEIFNVVTTDEAPTANEETVVNEVSVVAVNGGVVVKNAAGKKVSVCNILGQTLANEVLSSDNETINVPAGIVAVSVEGEEAVKVVVK